MASLYLTNGGGSSRHPVEEKSELCVLPDRPILGYHRVLWVSCGPGRQMETRVDKEPPYVATPA